MKLWIARERNNALWLYKKKPFYNKERGCWDGELLFYAVEDYIFPEVTFENSPQQVEITLLVNN